MKPIKRLFRKPCKYCSSYTYTYENEYGRTSKLKEIY